MSVSGTGQRSSSAPLAIRPMPENAADMLDEALAIIQAVWSGEAVDFEGEHYTITENRFAPRPIGKIPIWVAGMLPNLRPLRRAARFDGVVPMRSDEQPLDPSDVAMIAGYVMIHRQGDEALRRRDRWAAHCRRRGIRAGGCHLASQRA